MGVSYPQWNDDDQLLAALGEALQGPPGSLVEEAKALYTWREVDAELAQLIHDSALDDNLVAGMRAELASVRRLAFETRAGDVTLELEVTPDGIVGQVWPRPLSAELEVGTKDGAVRVVELDEVGGFFVHLVPPGPFRLSWHASQDRRVLTVWITL
jgi:hypothetical protein